MRIDNQLLASDRDTDDMDVLLTMSQVRRCVPLSASQIYRLMTLGQFPELVKAGTRSFWRKSDIVSFLANPDAYHGDIAF